MRTLTVGLIAIQRFRRVTRVVQERKAVDGALGEVAAKRRDAEEGYKPADGVHDDSLQLLEKLPTEPGADCSRPGPGVEARVSARQSEPAHWRRNHTRDLHFVRLM